jgi:hypothetical protein
VRYFPDLSKALTSTFDLNEKPLSLIKKHNITKVDLVIIGGGGLLDNSAKWNKHIWKWCMKSTCTLWGIGHNMHVKAPKHVAPLLKYTAADIIPLAYAPILRDFHRLDQGGYNSALDATCFLPYFADCSNQYAKSNAIKKKVGYYLHKDVGWHARLVKNTPKGSYMTNRVTDINIIMKFLCSHEVIVTSTYHGVLWATYMNAKVYTVDIFSEKFHYLPFNVSSLTNASNAKNLLPKNSINGSFERETCMRMNTVHYDTYIRPGVKSILSKSATSHLLDNNAPLM